MNIKKRITIAVLFCMILALLVGCTNHSETKKEEGNVIRIVYPTSRAMGEKNINDFKEWFSKSFPDAKLELVSSAITTISDTISSEFNNGNGPDIFVTTEYDRFVQAGYFADITSIPALTKFRKSSVRSLEREGKVYALPIGGGVLIALHYNKTLFDQYGLKYPDSSETLYEIVKRINRVIEKKELDKTPIGASLLYPSQASAVINGALSQFTQTDRYLQWITNYGGKEFSFDDKVFQEYLHNLDYMLNTQKNSKGNDKEGTGLLFSRDDYSSTQASSITSFLNGLSFMYLGDVNRIYSTYGTEGNYDKSDVAIMGIPVGIHGVDYLSYMDELYMGINSDYSKFSLRKQEIISKVLDYITDADDSTKNIFTYTGDYCSVHMEGTSVKRNKDDEYFKEINDSLDQNYVAQEVNNTPFSSVFGKILLAWKKGELGNIVENDKSNQEKVTEILDTYYKTGVSLFSKSEKTIGKSNHFMECQTNIVRSRETAVANQVADMARDYMNADFALINSGGIRASIPEGDISAQTLNAILPYENHIVNIKVSGATLKKALQNAYNVGPIYKLGKFGAISGLKVQLETNKEGYKNYKESFDSWAGKNPKATETQKNIKTKEIVEKICQENPDALNLKISSITDENGKSIDDNTIYTVATLDYLLTGGDDYSMLAVLSDEDHKEADTSIELYDHDGNRFTGKPEQIVKKIETTCSKSADAFANWVLEGNVLDAKVDGRIKIKNFVYVE